MSEVTQYMQQLGINAKKAARAIAKADSGQKNTALEIMASEIESQQAALLKANALDMEAGKANGLDEALLDRLALDEDRIAGIAEGLRQVAALPDPVGEIDQINSQPSGIKVGHTRVPPRCYRYYLRVTP